MIPDHAIEIADVVQPFGALVVASLDTPHVTVVHQLGQAEAIDDVIVKQGLRGERIDATRVMVFGPSECDQGD
jgi:hypothetical protein